MLVKVVHFPGEVVRSGLVSLGPSALRATKASWAQS